MTRQLILVRHGQTVHNIAGIAQGWNDSELSDAGREQVQRLAESIAALHPTSLYSSPLGRALATAEAIAAATGLPIVQMPELREMNYGGWEGRSFLDVRREDEAIYQQWIADAEAKCPSGESHADVRRRLEQAFAKIDGGRSVVVSHGTAIRIAATALLDVPTLTARNFAQDNAAMNVFLWRSDHWVLKAWNQTEGITRTSDR